MDFNLLVVLYGRDIGDSVLQNYNNAVKSLANLCTDLKILVFLVLPSFRILTEQSILFALQIHLRQRLWLVSLSFSYQVWNPIHCGESTKSKYRYIYI